MICGGGRIPESEILHRSKLREGVLQSWLGEFKELKMRLKVTGRLFEPCDKSSAYEDTIACSRESLIHS